MQLKTKTPDPPPPHRPFAVTQDEAINLCKMGMGHDCCRYLIMGGKGFECAKRQPQYSAYLDERVAHKTMVARADNCGGKTE